MVYFYIIPKWFLTYGVSLELIFSLITLLVAIYSFKIYRLSEQEESKYFGIGFLLISVSYLIWALINAFLIDQITDVSPLLRISQVNMLSNLSIYAHLILFISGIVILSYLSLKVKNWKVLLMMLFISITTIVFAADNRAVVYLIPAILLGFIIAQYFIEYNKTGNPRNGMMLFAFIFLLIGKFNLFLPASGEITYVANHILEMIAYSLVLGTLIYVIKHGEKKNKA